MFYINSVYENVVNFEMSYRILQLFVKILYFLMYSPIMAINVAESCSCWYGLQYIVTEGNSRLHNVVLLCWRLFCCFVGGTMSAFGKEGKKQDE
jgi:hypothetical protein